MAKTKPPRTAPVRKDKNGKKEGVSGSSFFTWFMVIALLGVWTSVAVVWFDLVDYEEVLGKLGIYDADGDGDFDVDDAKVLLGIMERPAQATTEDEQEEEPVHPDDLEDVEEIIKAAHIHEAQHSPPDEETEEDQLDDAAPFDEDGALDAEYPEEIFNDGINDLAAEPQWEPEEEVEIQEETFSAHIHSEPELEQDETEGGEEDEPTEDGPADGNDSFDALDEEDETDNAPEEEESEYKEEEYQEPESVQETEPELESVQLEESEHEHDSEPEQASEPHHEFIPEVEPEAEADPEPVLEHEHEHEPEVELKTESEHEPKHQQEEPEYEPETEYQGEPEPEHESEVEALYHEQEHETEEEEDTRGATEHSHEHMSDKHPNEQEIRAAPAEQQQAKPTEKKKKPKLLNKFDKSIKAELDAAEKLRKKGKTDEAVKAFEELVRKYPQSPRSRYGKAQCEDDLAEKIRSNEVLQKAIGTYEEVASLPNAPSDLIKLALKRQANRQQFLGRTRGSLGTLQKVVQLFPDDVSLKNDLGVGYLLLGDNNGAKKVYEEVLSVAPNDGFAKVHYGFILKSQNQIAESIPYLKEGLESGDPGTDDGRFYFHLGDAMQRVGNSEAYKWYEIGHKRGHFASVWQRSLYNVDGLKAQPWWTSRETGYTDLVRTLEKNWKVIRDEGLAVMDKEKGLFKPEDENLREKGDWSQYTLWQQGRKNDNACNAAPRTCALLERYPESTGCRRGQVKYSVMHPGTHVWPHTGPTNCRLRMHLGLVIPKDGCRIRCANDTRSWDEGKVLIFDDSFEHEVWQDADQYRMIFIVDVWHPELTTQQRRTLPAI